MRDYGNSGNSRVKNPTRWTLIFCVLSCAFLCSTPAFAQCTLNGSAAVCSLSGPLTYSTFSDAAGTLTIANGALTNTTSTNIQSRILLNGDLSLSSSVPPGNT